MTELYKTNSFSYESYRSINNGKRKRYASTQTDILMVFAFIVQFSKWGRERNKYH